MAKYIVPFRTGDVVKITKATSLWNGEAFSPIYTTEDIGQVHIVERATWSGNGWRYATDHGAWWEHKCFTLVEAASPKSIKKLIKAIKEKQ